MLHQQVAKQCLDPRGVHDVLAPRASEGAPEGVDEDAVVEDGVHPHVVDISGELDIPDIGLLLLRVEPRPVCCARALVLVRYRQGYLVLKHLRPPQLRQCSLQSFGLLSVGNIISVTSSLNRTGWGVCKSG